MAATIKIKMSESQTLGEVDTYSLTWRVIYTEDIDANIFVVEYTKTNPHLNQYDSEFHHVAYLPEMTSVSTNLDVSSHQYIRQSFITRTYPTIERMEESKKVMLGDIQSLLKAYNTMASGTRETEITITDTGYTSTVEDETTYTFDGEEIII
jgi:hypothetical protein